MFNKDQAHQLIGKVLKYSRLPECTVTLTETERVFVRFANNGITTSGFTSRRQVSIASTRDRKTGVIETSEIEDAALRAAVARSEELAAIAPENPEYMSSLGPQEYTDTGDYDEETAGARSPVLIPQISAIVDQTVAGKLVAAGFFERSLSASTVANKAGLFGYHRSTYAYLSTTVRTPDGTSSGWAERPCIRIREINGAMLGESAIGKCLRWKNPRRLEPGKYTVVLESTAVGDLVGNMAWAFQARGAEEGRTFLSKDGGGTRLGEKLFPEIITLRSDPFGGKLPALPWTWELIPNRPVTWVDKGVVRNLFYDRYWAAKTNHPPTPGPRPLVLDGSDASLEELIRSVDRGLLVTRFWYIVAVNPKTLQLTGLTRDGLFLIENGKIATSVMNFRFNESPIRMLQNTQRLGRPSRTRGEGGEMIAAPLVATDFTFTSISDAV